MLPIPTIAFEWLGYLGVAFYLGAYGLLQTGILRGSGYLYTTLNLMAAILVLLSLTVAFNMSSALIQVSWILISLAGLTRLFLSNYRVNFTDAERIIADNVFHGASPSIARRFLDAGTLFTAPVDYVLTVEGEPVKQLSYIISGRAKVKCGGRVIGDLAESFVGEMNSLREGPASATVVVDKEAQVFTISSQNLQTMCKKDIDFAMLINLALTEDTGRKLIAANVRLSG